MELKPCPFCGSEANYNAKCGRNGWFIFVKCDFCMCESRKIGIGRNTELPNDDDLFWKHPNVVNSSKKLAECWNKRYSECQTE